MKVPKKYEIFYHAVVAWNHDKNWQTFKTLWCNCCEPWVPIWAPVRLWYIVKDTANGVYKDIEKDFQIVENNA